MAIPVLLLAYKRPKNTREIFDLVEPKSRVYLFVDHDEKFSDSNKAVKDYVNELSSRANVFTNIQLEKLGPGKAMIHALDWAFESEETLLILEDDVYPNAFAVDYLNSVVKVIGQNKNLLATLRSPMTQQTLNPLEISGISKFALTNGWFLTREIWMKFRSHAKRPLLLEFMTFFMRHPFSIRREFFFFYAAAQVSRNEIVSAWDTQFEFFCLINRIKTLTPNKSCIEIRGVDEVASNTIAPSKSTDDVFWRADSTPPAMEIKLDFSTQKYFDKLILEEIYHIRWWHFFSPLKSYLRIMKKRFVQFDKLFR